MARKILSGILIGLSAVLLVAGVLGVIAAWVYNEPLTKESITRLGELDTQLVQTQGSMVIAETEIERALRVVDAAQAALEKLSEQTTTASNVFEGMKDTIDNQLLPGLEKTRTQVVSARNTLQSIQDVLDQVNTIPLLNIQIPDNMLQNLIDTTNSIDTQIGSVETMARQASTFVGDTAYLLGGDLTETHDNLQTLLTSVQAYNTQITAWRGQIAQLQASLPGWIDTASIVLTVFLLWFAFSQFGLILHGLMIWRGGDPLEAVRRQGTVPPQSSAVRDETAGAPG